MVVQEVRGKCTSGMQPGDFFVLHSGRLYIPADRHFCLYALQAVLPPLMKAGRGQVVILTSASAVRGPYDFIPYVPMRVAANNLIECAAMTAAEPARKQAESWQTRITRLAVGSL